MKDFGFSDIFNAVTAFFTGGMFTFGIYKYLASSIPTVNFITELRSTENGTSKINIEIQLYPTSNVTYIKDIESKKPSIRIAFDEPGQDDKFTTTLKTGKVMIPAGFSHPSLKRLFIVAECPESFIDTHSFDISIGFFSKRIIIR